MEEANCNPVLDLGIEVFTMTGNHIIFCRNCGFWIDSAFKYEDAIIIKQTIEQIAATDPLPKYNFLTWKQWIDKHYSELLLLVNAKQVAKILKHLTGG